MLREVPPVTQSGRPTMALTLHIHPLSMPSWAVLIALYENETPFELKLVRFEKSAEVKSLEHFHFDVPMLIDTSAEIDTWRAADMILWHLSLNHPGRLTFTSESADLRYQIEFSSFCFSHLHLPILELVHQASLNADERTPTRSQLAQAYLESNYTAIERCLADRPLIRDGAFTAGDCWAAAALYHANRVYPFERHSRIMDYWGALMKRPSVLRVIREYEPYFDRIADYGIPASDTSEREKLIRHWGKSMAIGVPTKPRVARRNP